MPEGSMSMQVKGAQDFERLVQHLKILGDRELKAEFYKALNRAAKPVKAAAQRSARQNLPQRGGLAERVARSRFTVKKTTRGNRIGVRVVGSNKIDIASLNRGRLRWPVYPKKGQSRSEWTWRERPIRPGWWDQPIKSEVTPRARQEIVRVIEDVQRGLRGNR